MCDQIFFEEHGDVGQVLRSAEEMIDSCGSNGTRGRRENVVHDGKVMHSQVPYHVDISLEQAEVDARGIVVENIAEHLGFCDGLYLADGSGVDERMIDHKR